ASERLTASGEFDTTRNMHLRYCHQLAREAEPFLTGPMQAEWLNRLETERDNLRAAFDYAATSGQVTTALQLANTLRQYWFLQAIFNQELIQLERLLANADSQAPTLDRACALITPASLLISAVGEITRGEAYAAESLSITQNQPDSLV